MRSIMEREAFAQRLKMALAAIGDDGSSPTRLAKAFNRRYPGSPVTLHAARKWLQGEAIPSQDKLRILADWLGVASDWLRYGNESPTCHAKERAPSLDYELAREISALSLPHQDVVRALVKSLLEAEKRPVQGSIA
ncbi:MAG: hypothetical protein IPN00_00510 [Hydrogenophilales bacterium]|jgi:transcriptional regulator with XRE-family HTH domain|nr:hypothetical protein [Hydrogenophilales bacterium]